MGELSFTDSSVEESSFQGSFISTKHTLKCSIFIEKCVSGKVMS